MNVSNVPLVDCTRFTGNVIIINLNSIYEQFAQRDEWTLLCDTLASRLMSVGNTLAATLCYICAGNIDKTVEIWFRSLTTEHARKSYVDLLQVIINLDAYLKL